MNTYPYVIVGFITLCTFTTFIWFVRLTKNKPTKKKLKIVHGDQHATQMFV